MALIENKLNLDDVAGDVAAKYVEMLTCESDSDKVLDNITKYFCSEVDDQDDAPLFWISLANVQWNYGRLDEATKEKALFHIKCGLDNENGQNEWIYRVGGKTILEKVLVKLTSEQPDCKTIRKKKKYICPWKNGDVYAYKMNSEDAIREGKQGQYLFFVKIADSEMHDGNIVPIVYMYHIMSKELLNIQQIVMVTYIPQFWVPEVYKKNTGRKPLVRLMIETTSERAVPERQLIFLGNIDVTVIGDEDTKSRSVFWKYFEREMIRNFAKWEGHSIEEIL